MTIGLIGSTVTLKLWIFLTEGTLNIDRAQQETVSMKTSTNGNVT